MELVRYKDSISIMLKSSPTALTDCTMKLKVTKNSKPYAKCFIFTIPRVYPRYIDEKMIQRKFVFAILTNANMALAAITETISHLFLKYMNTKKIDTYATEQQYIRGPKSGGCMASSVFVLIILIYLNIVSGSVVNASQNI